MRPLFSNKKKNQERFKKLAYPHVTFLYNMALRYTGNTYDAEDMVQDTMFIALKKIGKLREDAKCKPWLFAILRSVYLKELRLSCRRQKFDYDERLDYIRLLEAAADGFDTEKAFEKKFEAARLHEMVEKLPEKYKSPLLLHYMEGLSYQEMAEYLGTHVGTVMSRLSRARDCLKKEMLKVFRKEKSFDNVVEFNKKRRIG